MGCSIILHQQPGQLGKGRARAGLGWLQDRHAGRHCFWILCPEGLRLHMWLGCLALSMVLQTTYQNIIFGERHLCLQQGLSMKWAAKPLGICAAHLSGFEWVIQTALSWEKCCGYVSSRPVPFDDDILRGFAPRSYFGCDMLT